MWHASCTCKMGLGIVVLAIHANYFGVHGVRVVDASAFPFLPPGHPKSTVRNYSNLQHHNELLLTFADALAEKIANDIKQGQ